MRLTENAVMETKDGRLAHVVRVNDPADPANNKRKIVSLVAIGTDEAVAIADAKPIVVDSLSNLARFLDGFNALRVDKRSGYDSYVNNYGPTNPESPRDLTTQGLLKIIAVYSNVLHERVAKGGADGDEAKAALALITARNETAAATIIAREKESLLTLAAGMFTPEQIAAAKAKLGVVPPSTVTAAEADDTDADVQAALESKELENREADAIAAE